MTRIPADVKNTILVSKLGTPYCPPLTRLVEQF